MHKSIYSLVLSDDVVSAIDLLAYENGTSRSNLINQILASHVSLNTPEMQMQSIFSHLEKMMGGSFQILNQASDSMFSLRSPLRYKYKPSIRYQLELSKSQGPEIGVLKVSLRTQNRQLIDLLDQFFALWARLEDHYIAPGLGHDIRRSIENGRLLRELYYPTDSGKIDGEDIGSAIADYIQMTDDCIKCFFENLNQPENTAALVEQRCRSWLRKEGQILI